MTGPADPHAILSDAQHPAWDNAGQIALATYRALRETPERFPDAKLVHENDILQEATSWSAMEHHPLSSPIEEGGTRVRATAFSELHRKYEFTHRGAPLDFHVQGVAIGLDAAGNYFLRASVGCEGGRPNAELEVLAMFIGTRGLIGAIRWMGHLDDNEELAIVCTGHDPRLVDGFESIGQVHLRFSAEPHTASEA